MTGSSRFSYLFGAFRLDPVEKVLFQAAKPIPLTPKAIETLIALVVRHGHLVTKEELLRTVWPDTFVEENNLAQNIAMLRRVLGDGEAGRQFIETVPKRGYRFVGPVEERTDPSEVVPPQAAAPVLESPRLETAAAGSRANSGRRSRAIWSLTAAALLTLAIAAGARMGARRSNPARTDRAAVTRLAVLPFVNLGSADEQYFVAGMTEEITSRLASLNRLAVSSSTTVSAYDRRGKTVPRIGADLGVDYVVEGSVRWALAAAGTQVRITPKLIRVADDAAVWTQQYDASLSDLFGVQADIAFRITDALQMVLEARERRAVEARPTADTDAYLTYLRGITTYQHGGSNTDSVAQARAHLESAVARDSRFAVAWSWLARVYATQYNSGAQRKPEIRQAAERAAQTAIDLDPGLPEAHLALAAIVDFDRDREGALRELEIARVGLPNSAEVFRLIGAAEQRNGHWPAALAAFMRGFALEPAPIAEAIAVHYLHRRQYAEAGRFIAVAKAGSRASVVVPDAWMRFSEGGNVDAARQLLEPALATRSSADARVRGFLALLEWFDGRHQRALALIDGMDAAGAWMPADFRFPASVAAGQVYESMGRRDDAARHYAAAMAELQRRQSGAPDDFQIEAALGLAAAGLGRASEAVRHGERAVSLQPVTKDAATGPLYLYLLAEIQARIGQPAAAFATLDRLFSVPGFYNEIWVQRDPGFAALRSDPTFHAHVDRWSLQKGEVLFARRDDKPY